MKKWLVLALCVLFGAGSARAAVSVRMDAGAALLDREGNEILSVGSYGDIVPLGNDLFAGEDDGLYALLGSDGAQRGDAHFQEVRSAGDFLLAKQDGKWAMLNRDGSWHSKCAYTLILPGKNGCWALKEDYNDNESDLLYLLDADGSERETGLYVRELHIGSADELLPVQLQGESLWGYCDTEGKMEIPPSFDYAGAFVNDRAAVVAGGKYGCIDRGGSFVVPAEFDYLEVSPAGFIAAAQNMIGAQVFDRNGTEIARYEGQDVYIALVGDGYAVTDMEKTRICSADGTLLAEASPYAAVSEGIDGQIIISDGAWGEKCVYLQGSETKYQNLYPLGMVGGEAVYACMTANVGRYMNDLLGEIQLSVDMDSLRYGVVNADGEVLLESVYHSLEYLEDDRLLARTDEQWQMISADGTVLWSLEDPMQIEGPSF